MRAIWLFGVSMRAVSPGSSTRTRRITLALRDVQREIGIVQPRKMQAGVGCQAELADAEVDFGAAVIAHPEIVAARDRIVDADGDPLLRRVLRRQEQLAADVRDTADARAQVVIRPRRQRTA